MTPKYRPDIDGLRAIAVLSIVLFHMRIPSFHGGYVGVDIFFVISGYLITSIIVRELAAGRFSIAVFYERRVRRILPALIVVLVATLLVGTLLLTPEQLADLGRGAAATSVFSSNVFFFLGSGYFDGPSEVKPLLHTWSLAVEEQYYILFPFFLMLIARRFSSQFAVWLISLCVLSFTACVLLTRLNPTAAFYLIPFRAWELLIGSVLALQIIPQIGRRAVRNVISLLGLSMMLVAVFVFTPATSFPGAAAAVPTVGTALVIHAGASGGSMINRAISIRPLVFVGIISYSLYLWHWPIVVYAKHYLINEPTETEAGIIFLLIFLLSTLSWKFVETPFRNRQRIASRKSLFAIFSTASGVVLCASLALVLLKGFPGRNAPALMNDIVAADPGWRHWRACMKAGEKEDFTSELCGMGQSDVSPTFVLWGDSHALALASAINLSATRHDSSGVLATRSACAPLLPVNRPGRESCNYFNESMLEYVAAHTEIETIILAARWALSTTGARYKNEPGEPFSLAYLDATETAASDNVVLFQTGLQSMVTALESLGKNIVLVTQVPEIGIDVPSANYSARLTGRDINAMIAPSTIEYSKRTASVTRAFEKLHSTKPLSIIDPSTSLCTEGTCRVVQDGIPLYRDDDHLSLYGCLLVSPLFDRLFADR